MFKSDRGFSEVTVTGNKKADAPGRAYESLGQV